MSSSDFLKNYELAEPTIRGLYDSKLRLAILDALKDGPLRLADLRRTVGANAPNTSTKAKDLEEMGIIERVEGDFQLTPYGKATLDNITESVNFHATYQKFKELFGPRDLSGVPDFLLKRLGDLKNSEIIYEESGNLRGIDEYYYQLISKYKKFACGVLPILDPEWIRRCIPLFKSPFELQLVMTDDVLKGFKKEFSTKEKEVLIRYPKFRVYLIDEAKVLFAACGDFFSINFKEKAAKRYYQQESDLLSFDPKAIQWGLDLFEYYKKQAKPVKLSDYL